MENPGEHLVGQFLKYLRQCDFVEYNLETKGVQGEIDVIGINSSKKKVYVCEVATHLTGHGLQYTKDNKPDNVNRFMSKFSKDKEYADTNFPDFAKTYMLWTPIALASGKKGAVVDPVRDLEILKRKIRDELSIELEIISNRSYMDEIVRLREVAAKTEPELKSQIMRFLQIEEWLKKTIERTKTASSKKK